jgi:hypothetical protein
VRPWSGLDRSLVYLTDTNQAPKLQNRLPTISGLRNNIQQTSDSPKCCRTNRSSFAQSNSTELVFQTLCWTYTIHRDGSKISWGALRSASSSEILANARIGSGFFLDAEHNSPQDMSLQFQWLVLQKLL